MIEFEYRARTYWIEPVSEIDHIGRIIAKRQSFYEIEMLENMANSLRPGATVLDVGANFGNHTIYLAGACQAHVTAFEPNEALFAALEKNITLNGLNLLAYLHQAAIGAHSGLGASKVVSSKNMGLSRFEESRDGDTPIWTIDELGFPHVDCMKVDVEGMELDVLKGARKTIINDLPILYVEIITDPELEAITEFLAGCGYERTRRFLEVTTPTYKFEAIN